MPNSEMQKNAVRPTVIVEAPRLEKQLGIKVFFASETFQRTGSFKFRAAYNVASHVTQQRLITASSGNFGQALAYACSLLGKSCIIIMPTTAAKVKVDAVREYGGTVKLVDTQVKSRAEYLQELAQEYPEAYVASPFDDPLIIEGNAGLGEELCAANLLFDSIVVPIGGGGLSSGIITAVRRSGKSIQVIGAEPAIANDAARSLKADKIIANEIEPLTIADGARTLSIGKFNFPILRDGLSEIIEVPEERIKEAVRLLFSLANLKAEPTGALSLAALLTKPEPFKNRSICCIISGGNVDPEVYRQILAG